MDDVHRLLRLELETLWVTNGRGWLTRTRTHEWRPTPLLAVAAGGDHVVWATSGTVTDGIAAELAEVLTGEKPPSAGIDVGWRPSTATVLLALLGGKGTVGQEERGPSFVLVDLPDPVERVECWASAHVDPVELKGLMPEHDRRNLVAPWAVAVVDGAVAAVCETARSAPASVEAGVWTYEPYRRQGFGAAATAAWATLAADRTVFYSTSWDNRASQRLAHSLGLRPLGHWWWVHRG